MSTGRQGTQLLPGGTQAVGVQGQQGWASPHYAEPLLPSSPQVAFLLRRRQLGTCTVDLPRALGLQAVVSCMPQGKPSEGHKAGLSSLVEPLLLHKRPWPQRHLGR